MKRGTVIALPRSAMPIPPLLSSALWSLAGSLLLLAACQQSASQANTQSQANPRSPAITHPTVTAPPLDAPAAATMPGLHNVVSYAPGLISGGVPEGEEGMHSLAAMGIKTIVSVDGATPDIEAAEKLGMRYVHLPISYDTVTPERQKQLAQVISTLPHPLYMHCHHGKHRSGAALGTAVVLTGTLTPAQAKERMKVSGTAKDYEGLWKVVNEARPLDAGQLRADPASFPKISVVTGMVATMSEIDQVFDLVKQAKVAGWKAPSDHPDLLAAKESARLHKLFAQLQGDADSKKLPDDYQQQLAHAIETTRALDAAVQVNNMAAADRMLDVLGKSCKECHKTYRDN